MQLLDPRQLVLEEVRPAPTQVLPVFLFLGNGQGKVGTAVAEAGSVTPGEIHNAGEILY